MSNITIPNLPAVTSLNGSELLLGVQSGSSVRITTNQVASLISGGSFPVPVSNGGTGDTSLTSNAILIGNGTGAVQTVTPPTGTNYVLVASAGSAPSWQATIPVTAGVDSVSFGSTGLTPSTATAGVVTVAGTLVAANGGTGQSSYAIGDLLYASSTTALSRLADVAIGSVLISSGTGVAPAWSASPTLTTSLTTPLLIGGTIASSALTLQSTSGVGTTDSITFKTGNNGAVTALTIASNGNATFLSTSTTAIGTLSLTNALTVGNGGTGTNTFTTNGVIYGNTTSALGVTAAGTTGQVLIGNTSAAPSWTTALTGITTLTATGAITFNTTTNNQSYTTTGAGTITITSGTLGSINNMTIGGTTAAAGTFTTATATTAVAGGSTSSSILTLESTSGAGTTDSIQFKVASQAEVARYDTSGAYFFKKVANAVNATATLTVAQLQGGIITSTTAAAVTMTLPTGTVLDTAGTGLAATTLATNETIQFTIKNTGATNAITVAVASGVTNGGVAGDLTIAASGTATYLLTKTGAATFVLYKQ